MALVIWPACPGLQRSLREMPQVLSWGLACKTGRILRLAGVRGLAGQPTAARGAARHASRSARV